MISKPYQLIMEAKGMHISVELQNNLLYNGILQFVDHHMNIELSDAICKNKKNDQKQQIFIRGSNVKFVSLPEVLENSLLLKQ
ncbi:Small nuclear ribonucleoprotein Sm D3 [Spironucleus salmonicida]|uniref:Small nuclear ribonucleoprotein Sm D3 n=1 Tax=Spironucleus salmonicida TaxID=348837 RepID=V6M0A2_9EUKA|nr:Small nuclear ribonucleoprotein Sm D3 [Spironucleus salmonicida]|eukprot:EST49471.1 Small nuclear ribonucleoprotein Sm D3 [Spironucleus salmonicida]